MTDITAAAAADGTEDTAIAIIEADGDNPAAPASDAPAIVLSEGQILTNRFFDHFTRLLLLHRRLVAVRGAIVASPSPSGGGGKVDEPPPRPTAFFAGLKMIANADDAVITAIERDIEDLAKLF